MLNKAFLAGVVAVKLAVLGLAAQFVATAPVSSDETLQADCPFCKGEGECFPGDGCGDC
jgi:hypothetical protein